MYIYNASQLDQRTLFQAGFGVPLSPKSMPWLYNSEQHATGSLVLARLLQSERCQLVKEEDAASAQLFLVPLVFSPKVPSSVAKVWDWVAPDEEDRLWSVCERFYSQEWKSVLPHWTEATAARHVFVPTDYFALLDFCRGADPAFPLLVDAHPSNAKLLARTPRISTGITLHRHTACAGTLSRQEIISAPLVSSVHLQVGDEQPWAVPRPRPHLVSYGGSREGQPRASALRQLLVKQCAAWGNATCQLVDKQQLAATSDALVDAFQAKLSSIFCLEPPGFGEHRKSQADALTLGCIPVMFVPRADEGIWPLHWGGWRKDSRILLDMDSVLNGSVDVKEVLEAIPAERVKQMQATIASNAHKIHYGALDTADDALELLLHALVDYAKNDAPQDNLHPYPDCFDGWTQHDTRADSWTLSELEKVNSSWRALRDRPCRDVLKAWGGCDAKAPSRKGRMYVRDVCMKTCGRCALSASTAAPDRYTDTETWDPF